MARGCCDPKLTIDLIDLYDLIDWIDWMNDYFFDVVYGARGSCYSFRCETSEVEDRQCLMIDFGDKHTDLDNQVSVLKGGRDKKYGDHSFIALTHSHEDHIENLIPFMGHYLGKNRKLLHTRNFKSYCRRIEEVSYKTVFCATFGKRELFAAIVLGSPDITEDENSKNETGDVFIIVPKRWKEFFPADASEIVPSFPRLFPISGNEAYSIPIELYKVEENNIHLSECLSSDQSGSGDFLPILICGDVYPIRMMKRLMHSKDPNPRTYRQVDVALSPVRRTPILSSPFHTPIPSTSIDSSPYTPKPSGVLFMRFSIVEVPHHGMTIQNTGVTYNHIQNFFYHLVSDIYVISGIHKTQNCYNFLDCYKCLKLLIENRYLEGIDVNIRQKEVERRVSPPITILLVYRPLKLLDNAKITNSQKDLVNDYNNCFDNVVNGFRCACSKTPCWYHSQIPDYVKKLRPKFRGMLSSKNGEERDEEEEEIDYEITEDFECNKKKEPQLCCLVVDSETNKLMTIKVASVDSVPAVYNTPEPEEPNSDSNEEETTARVTPEPTEPYCNTPTEPTEPYCRSTEDMDLMSRISELELENKELRKQNMTQDNMIKELQFLIDGVVESKTPKGLGLINGKD